MFVVKNKGVVSSNGQIQLVVEGVDLVDGILFVDIKFYIVYVDSVFSVSDNFDDINFIFNCDVLFVDIIQFIFVEIEKKYCGFFVLVIVVLF